MPSLPTLTPSDVIRALERAGFVRARRRGSHLRLKRGNLAVTVPIHARDLPMTVLRSILRQARVTEDEFRALL